MVSSTPRPLYTREGPGFHCTGCRAGVDGCGKSRPPPTGIRSPDHPARSESLYRLSYPGPFRYSKLVKDVHVYEHIPSLVRPHRCDVLFLVLPVVALFQMQRNYSSCYLLWRGLACVCVYRLGGGSLTNYTEWNNKTSLVKFRTVSESNSCCSTFHRHSAFLWMRYWSTATFQSFV